MSFIFFFAPNQKAGKVCLCYGLRKISAELQLMKLNLWELKHHILGWKKREVSHSSEVSAFPWSGFQAQAVMILSFFFFFFSLQTALNALTCVMLKLSICKSVVCLSSNLCNHSHKLVWLFQSLCSFPFFPTLLVLR